MTKLIGRNNTFEPHQSQWQKDRASPPFVEDERRLMRGVLNGLAWMALIAAVFYALVVLL